MEKSDVWTLFEKVRDEQKAQCTVCSKELSYHGGTTILRDYLVAKHLLLYKPKCSRAQRDQGQQQRTMNTFMKRHCSESNRKAITELINIAEGEGFIKLWKNI